MPITLSSPERGATVVAEKIVHFAVDYELMRVTMVINKLDSTGALVPGGSKQVSIELT